MASDRIKVVGYAQAVQYTNGIEYRNFTPDLVGLQLASNGGTPLFSMGSFYITTNLEPKTDKTFITNKFSNFVTLSTLNVNQSQSQTLLSNNASVFLNLDKTNLNNYALFGSLTEFIRVSLEDIITNWPASLFLNPFAQTSSGQQLIGNTYDNYFYNQVTQTSNFRVNTNFIVNKFQINYLNNGTILNSFSANNGLRNLTLNYLAYNILINGSEFPVVGFTGSTSLTNDYIYFSVQGDVFSGATSSQIKYHIKPNQTNVENFFNNLPIFEEYLLNRQVVPQYTASFKHGVKSDTGVILYVTDSVTWPTSDGYNIDFDTTDYINYASTLLDIATEQDSTVSDLMNRFLVSDSISEFDTQPIRLSSTDEDTSGQKINKTLRLYGAEFDKINNFISGIANANVVSYDKLDNTPDVYLKQLAKVIGWNLISSVEEQDLLNSYLNRTQSTYSGHTVGLTSAEADIELWRRLILNAPWIWKSKGARKSVEFLLNFIGAPKGLFSINEYVYVADKPIDVNLFYQILELNGLSTDLSPYPFDSNGYPMPLPNTSDLYFQSNGLWYRGGYKYINQFRTLIPNFTPVVISSQTITTGSTNLFINYDLGQITDYSGQTYIDSINLDGSSTSNCLVVTPSFIENPNPSLQLTDCGCPSGNENNALSICVGLNTNQFVGCPSSLAGNPTDPNGEGFYTFNYQQYLQNGSLYVNNLGSPIYNSNIYTTQECCISFNGTPFLYNQYDNNNNILGSGYICTYSDVAGCSLACNWTVSQTPVTVNSENYLVFLREDGSSTIVMPSACACIGKFDIDPNNPTNIIYSNGVPNIKDPYNQQIGYACQLTNDGLLDLQSNNSVINYYYSNGYQC